MRKENLTGNNTGTLLFFMFLAYLFSMGLRLYWPMYFAGYDAMFYGEQLMINTNDGYFFATGARDILDGVIAEDKQRISAFDASGGLVMLTVYATKLLPFSLETVILYMPAVISSLIVIPIILTGRLMGHTLLGFFAALLGSVAWSYYNRTMVGYYDTDMFSVFLQFTIFYTLLHIAYKKELKGMILAAFLMFIYPYFYPQGLTLIYAMFIMLVLYLFAEHRRIIITEETNDFKEDAFSLYGSVILLSIPLMIVLPIEGRIILLLVSLSMLLKMRPKEKQLFYIALAFFAGFLFFGNVFNVILAKLMVYLGRGVETEGLHFYQVVQTVREAGAIPFSTMANRISGSQIGVIVSLIGYVVLVVRHKPFIIALPLIGVGVLSLWAGLRFTVYAVPVAAISMVYFFSYLSSHKEGKLMLSNVSIWISVLFFLEQVITLALKYMPNLKDIDLVEKVPLFFTYVLNVLQLSWDELGNSYEQGFRTSQVEFYDIIISFLFIIFFFALHILFKEKKELNKNILYVISLTVLFLLPNITHIIGYKVPTVLKKAEVQDLVKLDEMADSKDYTLTWWDYGYPIWYYSNTNTLIDGGKHTNDNFIISKIMQSDSPEFVANLSRLAVETYVDSNYSIVADTLFKNQQEDQIDPNLLLSELEDPAYELPEKTRDIYLYLPYRMLNIFPTVTIFGNLDLTTGKAERNVVFYPTSAVSNKNGIISFRNGITFDAKKGEITLGQQTKAVKYFIVTQNTKQGKVQLQSQQYHAEGDYVVVYLKSYGTFVVMDIKTFNSTYVQMFMLEKYDKNLFELVVSSPYSKIYKLKK